MKKLLTAVIALWSATIMAQPGTLDSSFNCTDLSGSNLIHTISIQSDNKIIIGGNIAKWTGTYWKENIFRLNADGSLDLTFDPGRGADEEVNTTAIQSDGKIIIGGEFISYNLLPVNRLARLNTDGSLDNSFNIGSGANNDVDAISIQSTGKIIIAGGFTSYNGITRNYIARVNTDGSLDTSFDPGTGANGKIYSSVIQPDGKIIIGGDFTNYNGTARNRIARLNSNGTLDTLFNPGTGANYIVTTIEIQPDAKIIIGGAFSNYNGTSRKYIARLNPNGSLDFSFNPGSGASSAVNAIALQKDDKIIIGGQFNKYNGITRNNLARLNSDGSLDENFESGSGATCCVDETKILADGKIIISGSLISYNGINREGIARLHGDKGVIGKVFLDINQNCTQNTDDVGLKGRNLIVNPGNFIVQTNSAGVWHLDSLVAGTYTITADISGKWKLTCPVSQNFIVVNSQNLTIAPAFGFISTEPCPVPDVSIHMPFMRPCFSDQMVYVQACNQNNTKETLNSSFVEVQLDSLIILQSATLPFTNLGNNTYRFNTGNLNPGQCVNFSIACSLSCNAILGQTLCMKTDLFPADSCVFDTIPNFPDGVTPCTLPWDKSSLRVEGSCVNDSIRFGVYNTGDPGEGDMQCFSPVRIYLDGQFIQFDSVKLTGGDSAIFVFSGDGRTWRLEADQHPLHPGNSHSNATIELCGNSNNWTSGLVNILSQDDADPIVDIYCGTVTGSYDPNDKTGYPLGVTEDHFIFPNQQLQYVIRFQNTGTDTAFTVVIKDTLETDLDIFSVVSGVSSNNYTFRIYGQRILEWTFNNILLPDSNINEPGSHGFVTFTVNQNKDLANGTTIENSAGIYFDYNVPVITNTSLHTINDMLQIPAFAGQTILTKSTCDSINLNGYTYDATGTYLQSVETAGGLDSIITLNLTVQIVDTAVIQNNTTLSSNAAGADYQWVDCNNSYTPINEATNQNFIASSNGSYSVIITQNGCSDTSSCYSVTGIGINDNRLDNTLTVYPNPTSETIFFNVKNNYQTIEVEIKNLVGQIVQRTTFENMNSFNVKLEGSEGIYFYSVKSGQNIIGQGKMVKQ